MLTRPMDHIAGNLARIQHNIELVGADPVTRGGFTQVPNVILKSDAISPGAKLAYAMLLHYAWAKDHCFPGQERLANDMGAGKRSVIRFMAELERAGYIAVKRRGLGQTNLYQVFLQPTKRTRPARRGTV
ncbi:MAG: helix-turn-helix domain-containing protein [Hyphomicrobiaceae bacterium]